MTLRSSATPAEHAEMLAWVKSHGIDPFVVPEDGIDIDPGEGWARIEWLEFEVRPDGTVLITPEGDCVDRVGPFERIVRGCAPFEVRAGRKVPSTKGDRDRKR